MLKKFFLNLRRPSGIGGSVLLWSMNRGHDAMARWGLAHLDIKPADYVLDIGCGGGRNIAHMLTAAVNGKVCGLDYSPLSVKKSIKYNERDVAAGRCEIKQGNVAAIPYDEESFDIVTAFETVYFWPDFINDLKEVIKVLKPAGTFLICNEAFVMDGKKPPRKYFVKLLDLKIYSPRDFIEILTAAGFVDIKVDLSEKKQYICVTAQKPPN
jgi:ubiquinone/menaquinone biosynthesis C-methylase UbiE